MPDSKAPSQPQPQPRQLTERLRAGAARLYPATERQLDLVRQILRQRLERQQRGQSPDDPGPTAPPAPTKTRQKATQTPAPTQAPAPEIRQPRDRGR